MNDNNTPIDNNETKSVLSFANYKDKQKVAQMNSGTDKLETTPSIPPRVFDIELVGETHLEASGFLGVTPHFVAIADAQGNIGFVSPIENVYYIKVKPKENSLKESLAFEEK